MYWIFIFLLQIVLTEGDFSTWPNVFPKCSLNETLFPAINPSRVFEEYGYDNTNIPRDLIQFLPPLLHEENVLHVINHQRELKLINEGATSKLYEGQLRVSEKKVVLKKLEEGRFDDIMNEASISMYLQTHPHIPQIYGLLPYGPSTDDLSLVVEYVENCTAMFDLVASGVPISECQWLDIAYQATTTLAYIHQKFVLYNDMHEKNVLVQWRGDKPHVFLTDFGEASFRVGSSFSDTPSDDRHRSNFLGPEVWYDIATPASDVFSLGDMFLLISKHVKNQDFLNLAARCHAELPSDRPRLEQVQSALQSLFESSCLQHPEQTTVETGEPIDHCAAEIRKYKRTNNNDKCRLSPLPLILFENLAVLKEMGKWMNSIGDVTYSLAYYSSTNSTYAVKCYPREPYEAIRLEAAYNYIMNDTGYVMPFIGVTFPEYVIDAMCTIQGLVLDNKLTTFINNTKIDLPAKLYIAVELAKAVASFHSREVVLNCIEPDNIMLVRKEDIFTPTFIDLRRCSENDDVAFEEIEDDVIQNEYIAPECKERVTMTYASDVYSLGVLLQKIFGTSSDDTVTEIIKSCLEVLPAKRPSASDVERRFQEIGTNTRTH